MTKAERELLLAIANAVHRLLSTQPVDHDAVGYGGQQDRYATLRAIEDATEAVEAQDGAPPQSERV